MKAVRQPAGFTGANVGLLRVEGVSKLVQAPRRRTIRTSSRSCTGDFPVYQGLQEIKLLRAAARPRFDTLSVNERRTADQIKVCLPRHELTKAALPPRATKRHSGFRRNFTSAISGAIRVGLCV